MPYTVRGKCIYKKDTGKKVGCTKGDVKKYLAALHIHSECTTKYDIVCGAIALNESHSHIEPKSPEEIARRKRMMRRMAALGIVTGAGVTAAELMAHKDSRAGLVKAAKSSGVGNKLKKIGKQIWKPMAIGVGADLAIEPMNTAIAQKMEDRYQKRKESKV